MRIFRLVITSIAVFACIAPVGFHSQAQAADGDQTNSHQPRVLPSPAEPKLPPGPGRAQFVTQCVLCHSSRYVTMQPRFPRKVWESEVQKMVTAYKAPISDADQIQIVNYIVTNFGAPDSGKRESTQH